jgi:hypothetical protein
MTRTKSHMTRNKLFYASCIYIHGYKPSYLTIDIIYDIYLSILICVMGGFIDILVMYKKAVGKGGSMCL